MQLGNHLLNKNKIWPSADWAFVLEQRASEAGRRPSEPLMFVGPESLSFRTQLNL